MEEGAVTLGKTCYSFGMLRVVMFVLLVAIAAVPATAFSELADEVCSEDCGDDGASGDCAPATCFLCSCAITSSTILPASSSEPAQDGMRRMAFSRFSELAPPNPDPLEILHVPKSAA